MPPRSPAQSPPIDTGCRRFLAAGQLLRACRCAWWLAATLGLGVASVAHAQWRLPLVLPEARDLRVRDPSQLPDALVPDVPRPPTVDHPQFDRPPRHLSLNEAINIGLANSRVVRVLSGVSAVSSGRTIYDVAITQTRIDQEQARFDPRINVDNLWTQVETPVVVFDPVNPGAALVTGPQTANHNLNFGLSKPTITGGNLFFGVQNDASQFSPGPSPLNPQGRSALDLTLTQPFWQGGGATVNRVPIVLARIDTERSFFQFKDAVQQQVRGVIEGYWSLVLARTNLWARQQQVDQAQFANTQTKARLEVGDANAGDVAQTQVALENFRVSLLDAQSAVLNQEAALQNILGFPPYDPQRFIPVTPPTVEKLEIQWESLLDLAQQQRPDIIELKLVLEADQQLLLQSQNQAAPRVDGVASYRWNGVSGTMPNGMLLNTQPGQFTDWTLGVNFSVPLGLRRERALLRQQELIIARDRANLDQSIHQTVHLLAQNVRSLDLAYARYRRLQRVREAAKANLDQQQERYRQQLVQFITVLQAIVDWGNAVSQEAQSLTQYNIELANLEQQTGTILESHGIAFVEERFGALGPLGRLGHGQCYPRAMRPTPTVDIYGEGSEPSENAFDLTTPYQLTEEAQEDLRENLETLRPREDIPPPVKVEEIP